MNLEEFEKLANAATPGPWDQVNLDKSCLQIGPGLNGPETWMYCYFIAACRHMVPKLLKVVKEAEKVVKNLDYSCYFDDYEKAFAELEQP